MVKLERIKLAEIYKEDGEVNIDFTIDVYAFEIYGFLKLLVKHMEKELIITFDNKDDEDVC